MKQILNLKNDLEEMIYKLTLDNFIIKEEIRKEDLTLVSLKKDILNITDGYLKIDDPYNSIYILNTAIILNPKKEGFVKEPCEIKETVRKRMNPKIKIRKVNVSPCKIVRKISQTSFNKKQYGRSRIEIKRVNPCSTSKSTMANTKSNKSLKKIFNKMVENEYSLNQKELRISDKTKTNKARKKIKLTKALNLNSQIKTRKLNRHKE